jgi:hypothetical protein
LQAYLLSNELYWPLGANLPRLTVGALLLALTRLEVSQPDEADQLRVQVETVRVKWRSAWEQKIARETANRLRLWTQFLSDLAHAPEQNADAYPGEVRGRAILGLLLRELPNAPEKTALAEADTLLKARLLPAAFIWEAALQTAFPEAEFWFLYGTLTQNGRGRK